MPIEALAAVSLVGNILQFVEAGAKVLTKAKQIHDSADGLSDDVAALCTVIDELEDYNERLKDSLCPLGTRTVYTAADASLERLRVRCCAVNGELRGVLEGLVVEGRRTRWKSVKKAIANEWKVGRVQAVQEALFKLRDEMLFQITFSLKENVDLLALQQTEAFRQLDAATQAIVDAALENRTEILDVLCKHTLELQAAQIQAMEGAVDLLRDDMADIAEHLGEQLDVNQEELRESVKRASQVILEHESVQHQATRSVVELQTIELGDRIEAEGKEMRTLVLNSNNQMTLAVNRIIEQVQTNQMTLAMDRIIEQVQTVSDRMQVQALEHEQVKGWIVALLAQQARVIEWQATAMKAANESSAKTSSKKLRKAFKKAQEGLQAALEVLITLAEMFEQEVGLQYHTVRELISRNMGSVDAVSFIRYLLGQPGENNPRSEALPNDDTRGFLEAQTFSIVPSHVLTDAADPEIEAAFLQFFDIQLGRSSQRRTDELELAITSGTWDMALMSISWSVASTGPFWKLNRGYLQGLALPDWNKFKNQKWIFVHHNRELHMVETTSARDDTFLSIVPMHPGSTLKLAQFRWELIAGEDRLVGFEIWSDPLTSKRPKKAFLKYVRAPYAVRNILYSKSVMRDGIRAGDLQGHETNVIDNTPVFATEYGQPIRHALPQAVWGLVASDWDDERRRSSEDGLEGIKINIHWEIEIRRDSAMMVPVGD